MQSHGICSESQQADCESSTSSQALIIPGKSPTRKKSGPFSSRRSSAIGIENIQEVQERRWASGRAKDGQRRWASGWAKDGQRPVHCGGYEMVRTFTVPDSLPTAGSAPPAHKRLRTVGTSLRTLNHRIRPIRALLRSPP